MRERYPTQEAVAAGRGMSQTPRGFPRHNGECASLARCADEADQMSGERYELRR
jgi:hypothetical protein